MKKKFLSMLMVFLIATLLTSTVSAGGNVKLSSVRFSLGSLIADGFVKGSGDADITVVLDAKGFPSITCINPDSEGENVPGNSHIKVSASGQQILWGDSETDPRKRAFSVETIDPETLPWDVAGCPNYQWTAQIDFISWTNSTISVHTTTDIDTETLRTNTETETSTLLTKKVYNCKTKQERGTVSCKPVKGDDDDDDDH